MTKTHADNPLLGPLSRADFITENMPLVLSIARRFETRSFAANIPMDDVISEGAIGLILAYDRYADVSKSFATFAAPYIRGYITRLLRYKADMLSVPQHIKDATYRIIREGLEDVPTQDVARELGVSVLTAHEAKFIAKTRIARDLSQIDPPDSDDDEYVKEPGIADDQTTVEVREFLESLPDNQREVISLLVCGLTQTEVARELGKSRQAVRSLVLSVRKRYLSQIPGGKIGDLTAA